MALVEFENTPDVFHTSYFGFKVTDQGFVPFKCQVPQNGTITAETDYSISVWTINQKSNRFPFSAALFNFFCILYVLIVGVRLVKWSIGSSLAGSECGGGGA